MSYILPPQKRLKILRGDGGFYNLDQKIIFQRAEDTGVLFFILSYD